MNDSIRTLNLLEDALMEAGQRYKDKPLPFDRDDAVIELATYQGIVELLHAINKVRNLLVKEEAAALERVLHDAAPAGANPSVKVTNPREHPSEQPPQRPSLRIIQEDNDGD